MTNGLYRKHNERKLYAVQAKKRRKTKCDSCESHSHSKRNYVAPKSSIRKFCQYLNVDPLYVNTTSDDYSRLEGGGLEQDIFYDCLPNRYEEEPQLQVFEMINEIKSAKYFKSLLKQIAFSSNVLYRTFRQAYSQAKKCKQCRAHTANRNCGHPSEIINIELPPKREAYIEDVYHERRYRSKGKKSSRHQNYTKEQAHPCYMCASCLNFDSRDKAKVCTMCLGSLEAETDECCEKSSQKSLNLNKVDHLHEANQKKIIKKECDLSTRFPETPSCLVETNVCQQYEKELQHLDFCERCAVLRGEKTWPIYVPQDPLGNFRPNASEKFSQACQDTKDTKSNSNKLEKSLKRNEQRPPHRLNMNPVCLTIPLKLQIDPKNCQSRFVESEIVMETQGGTYAKSISCENPSETCPKQSLPNIVNERTQLTKAQDKSGSDLFYSCLSDSGIIKPKQAQQITGETALSEVLETIRKRVSNAVDPQQTSRKATSETKGTSIALTESPLPPSIITKLKAPVIRTGFTQTKETSLARIPQLSDPKAKAKQLRAELLEEIRSALEQSSPVVAIKAMLEGRRFSLPINLQPKEVSSITPPRPSLPNNYQNMTAAKTPNKSLVATTTGNNIPTFKPIPPPKPTKIATEQTIQTDVSAIAATGHYKRNELRNEIQNELKELLTPNTTKLSSKYDAHEREAILLDLNKLFHPEKAGRLPKQISCENVVKDIHYLLEPETNKPQNLPTTTVSQHSTIQSLRHILNPKTAQKARKKKYPKETKEQILKDLKALLTPRQKKAEYDQETQASILNDMRFMLDTGRLQNADTGPSSSRALQIRQHRQQKPPNEIRDSLLADIRYLLDNIQPAQADKNNTLEANLASVRQAAQKIVASPDSIPEIANKSPSEIFSDTSLSDNEQEGVKRT